jgi:Holliday junction resolvase
MKKKINSKQKGSRGEREWANFCKDQGYNVRRTQQYAGGTEESADCVGLPYIHQEVKRVEKLNIDEAMEQAWCDCNFPGPIPIVAHRKNGKRWKVTMYAEDWFMLYKEWEAGKAIESRSSNGKD